MHETPYISFVATSRNDGHGGEILKRMRLFVNGLIEQCNRFKLSAELIMVEWNPPENSPLLKEVLPKPQKGDFLSLRYIIVPNEIHKGYRNGDRIPLFQMIAKNVGIRRAKGEFVLCTNIDLLFSDELFEILAQKQLDPKAYYRANRCDVPIQIEEEWTWEKKMEFCADNILRRLGKNSKYPNLFFGIPPVLYRFPWLTWGLDKLGWMSRQTKDQIKMAMNDLDSQACGDFTMMTKDAWIDIQGYVELDLYSIHIDTLGLVATRAAGYEQVIFPLQACSYHIDHALGWEAMTSLEKIKFWEQRPGIGYDVVWETGMLVLKTGQKMDINPLDWGFLNHDLQEFSFPV